MNPSMKTKRTRKVIISRKISPTGARFRARSRTEASPQVSNRRFASQVPRSADTPRRAKPDYRRNRSRPGYFGGKRKNAAVARPVANEGRAGSRNRRDVDYRQGGI